MAGIMRSQAITRPPTRINLKARSRKKGYGLLRLTSQRRPRNRKR